MAAQERDGDSILNLYRAALALRPQLWVGAGDVRWLASADGVLGYARGEAQCWVNTGDVEIALPEGFSVLLASEPGIDGVLPPNAAAWVRARR